MLGNKSQLADSSGTRMPKPASEARLQPRRQSPVVTFAQAGTGPVPVFRPDEELLIFELRWKDVILNEAMIGYLDGARVLLPLGETLQSLDFPDFRRSGRRLCPGLVPGAQPTCSIWTFSARR